MNEIENAIGAGVFLAAWDERPGNEGQIRIFRVSAAALEKRAEATASSHDREALTERLIARGVRIGASYPGSGCVWVIDDAGFTSWKHQHPVVERLRPPANAKSIQFFVDPHDAGTRAIRFVLHDGTFDTLIEEKDPAPALDPAYGDDDLAGDTQWAQCLAYELSIWARIPFEDTHEGDSLNDHLAIVGSARAIADQLATGTGEITESVGPFRRASGLFLRIAPDRHSFGLRVELANGRSSSVTLKSGSPSQLAAYLRRVTTPAAIIWAMNGTINQLT